MSSLEERKQYIIERVSNMVVYGATMDAIALATGLGVEELERVQQWPEYQQTLRELQTEKFEQQKLIEQGWDFLEAKSLQNLSKVIEYNKDPDLNLRVATVANKASRSHNGAGNNTRSPIDPGSGVAQTVVLNLGINFVEKIKRREIPMRDDKTAIIDQKDIDCLSQGDVEDIFEISKSDIEAAADEIVQGFE